MHIYDQSHHQLTSVDILLVVLVLERVSDDLHPRRLAGSIGPGGVARHFRCSDRFRTEHKRSRELSEYRVMAWRA